jgi:hypothetical protein
MLAFPCGLRLKYSRCGKFPIPTYFTFVFTDEKGGHIYAGCLKFYECIQDNQAVEIFKDACPESVLPDNVTLYSPKVLCVLSTHPFYRAMKGFLSQLYSMSLSAVLYPLEFFIVALVDQIPLPMPGGRAFHYSQDIALLGGSSKALSPIIFSLPPERFYPFLDLDFSAPLRCLTVDNLLLVFSLLLREAKVIFICPSENMITEVMETFKHLLFPLTWATTYVTRLPHSLIDLFDALGGFMIGYNTVDNPDADLELKWALDHSINDSKSHTTDNDEIDMEWVACLAPQTFVVDLARNRILCNDGKTFEEATDQAREAILQSFPTQSINRVKNILSAIFK